MIRAALDRGGLEAGFEASMQTPCVAEKLAGTTFLDFAERVREMRVLSFYDDDKPIGAAVFHDDFGHIGILPEYHGRWATRIAMRAIAEAWGASPVALVDARNTKALKFTAQMGLRPVEKNGNMVRFQ